MPDIVPSMRLDITYPAQAWGRRTYCGDSFSWNVIALYGSQGARYSGYTLDASGDHLIQQPVHLWAASDETQWTPSDGYTYTHGTEPSSGSVAGGTLYLIAVPPVGNVGAAFRTIFRLVRGEGEGFHAFFYRGAVPSGTASSFYIALNQWPPTAGPLPDDWTGYRLAFVPGATVTLQTSPDGSAWTDAATAHSAGESEAYLNTVQRQLEIDVLPKTDPSWAAGLPLSAARSGPPPNQVDVTVNGSDILFTLPCTAFYGGQLAVSGTGGQWSCVYAVKRFALVAQADFAPQSSRAGRAIVGNPRYFVQGYVGDVLDTGGAAVTLLGPQTVAASLLLNATATADATGYAPRTCFLTGITVDYPAIFGAPPTYPDIASVREPDLCLMSVQKRYAQSSMTRTNSAQVLISNNAGAYAPGNVPLAARAATLWAGGQGFAQNDGDPFGEGLWPQVSGWTLLDKTRWGWQHRQNRLALTISGRLRRGMADQVPCGYMAPDDGDVHYAAIRRLAYKLGFADDWQLFPYLERGQPSPYYYLPRGTARSPVLLPHPSTPVLDQMQTIRRLSGEYDPAGSGQVLPMMLGEDELGNLLYSPMPVGVVQSFLDPGLTLSDLGIVPEQVYSATPIVFDGLAALNELTDDGMYTEVDLTHVRTPIVYEGLDYSLGAYVLGIAYNELVGDGPYSNPDAAGNVGLDVPFYDISRYVTDADVAEFLAAMASVQLAVPSVSAVLPLVFQPNLSPLSVIANYEPVTQGTTSAVPYWTGDVVSNVSYLNPNAPEASTVVGCRLLGQPGDN